MADKDTKDASKGADAADASKRSGVLVIGLGRFGSALANELDSLDMEVLAVERDADLALARAEIQLQAGQYQQAIDTLQDARRSPGRYPQALASSAASSCCSVCSGSPSCALARAANR